jgi:hypothetical protein
VSWLDSIGDYFKGYFGGIAGGARPSIGGAFAGLSGTPEAAVAAQAMSAQSTANGNRNLFSPNTYTEPIQMGQEQLQTGVYHATSAAVQMAALGLGDPNAPKGSITDIGTWKAAWNRDITPVQAVEIAVGAKPGDVNFGDSQADVDARHHYFHDTLMGRIATGPLDMAFGFIADPTIVGAKYGKALSLSRITFKGAEEADDVLKLHSLLHSPDVADQAAVKTASRRQQRLTGNLEDFFSELDNKTLAEKNAHPLMPQSGGGVYALMFDEAEHLFPGTSPMEVAARREAQRTVFGAMIGNQDAIDVLKAKRDALQGQYDDLLNGPAAPSDKLTPPHPFPDNAELTDTPHNALPEGPSTKVNPAQAYADLTRRLENLSVPPASTRFEVAKAAGTDLETNLTSFQSEFDAEIREKMDSIDYEIQRLGSAIGNKGQVERVRGTFAERADYARQQRQLNTTYIDKGMGHTPIRVVSGLTANRLPGHVAVDDPETGVEQFTQALNRADFLDSEVKQGFISDYLTAENEAARWIVVKRAEAHVIHSILTEYGFKPHEIDQLIAAARDTEGTWKNILNTRAYSAHSMDQHVALFDPEQDEIYAIPRPILQSQLEHNVAFVDPRLMQKAAAQLKTNTFARVVRDGSTAITEDVLRPWNNLWKQTTLLRPSYAFRVQMDTQLRLVTYMGALAWMANVKYSVPAGVRWLASDAEGKIALKNILHPAKGSYEAALGPTLRNRLGLSDDQIGWAVRSMEGPGGTFADFVSNAGDAYLANMRATGQWQIYQKDDPMWATHFKRAINHQVMNDTLAKYYLMNGGGEDELLKALGRDKGLRAEWLNMKAIWPDQETWVHETKSMVDYYLADPEVRAHVMENEGIGDAAITKFFGGARNQNKKMDVHGESYLTMQKQNRAMKAIRGFRDASFKLLSDVPETIAGRHPMFMYSFNRRMATIQKMAGRSMTGEEMDAARWAAMKGAKADMRRVLYDAADMSNLSRSFGILSPFVAAWEDTMKKYGYILYNHPEASPRLDMIYDWPENLGLTTDEYGNRVDENGNRYDIYGNLVPESSPTYGKNQFVTLPFKLLSGGRIPDVTLRREGLNTAFQGENWYLPGFGPMVQIPTNWLLQKFAPTFADSGVGKLILPFGITNDSPEWQVAPSWARNLANAFDDSSQDNLNQFSLYMQQEITNYKLGKRKTLPTTDEIAGMVKNHFLLKMLSGAFAPVNVTPKGDLDFYHTVATNFRQLYGSTWPDSIPEAQRTNEQYWEYKYRQEFPDYYLMTISLSVSNDGIAATPAGHRAQEKYRGDIAQSPEYGALFAGVDSQYGDDADHKFSQGAYTWQQQQIGDGQTLQFRGEKSPVDAIKQANVSEGWRQYQSFMTGLDSIMQEYGITSLRKAPGLSKMKDAYVAYLSSQNDDWAAAFGQHNTSKSVEMLKTAVEFMDRHPEVKDRADMQAIQQYLTLREQFRGALAQAGVKSIDASKVANTIAPAWDEAMNTLKQSSIGFEQEFNRWLANDDLSQELN